MFSYSGKLECGTKGCQHMCVIERNKPVCKCHNGFKVLDDGSCIGERYIVLYFMYFRIILYVNLTS